MDNFEQIRNKDVFYISLRIVKRRVPKKIAFVRTVRREPDTVKSQINGFIFFYRNFETRFQIREGDVFMVKMPCFQSVGCELSDDHFYAALLDSEPNNPLIRVVPLKSYIEGQRVENPASDVRIGRIAGTEKDVETIAVINQTRSIDKMRLFSGETIKSLSNLIVELKDYQEINVATKRIFRLNKIQLMKIRQAVSEYDFNGYIRH